MLGFAVEIFAEDQCPLISCFEVGVFVRASNILEFFTKMEVCTKLGVGNDSGADVESVY